MKRTVSGGRWVCLSAPAVVGRGGLTAPFRSVAGSPPDAPVTAFGRAGRGRVSQSGGGSGAGEQRAAATCLAPALTP
jgi:hypothetical protein